MISVCFLCCAMARKPLGEYSSVACNEDHTRSSVCEFRVMPEAETSVFLPKDVFRDTDRKFDKRDHNATTLGRSDERCEGSRMRDVKILQRIR